MSDFIVFQYATITSESALANLFLWFDAPSSTKDILLNHSPRSVLEDFPTSFIDILNIQNSFLHKSYIYIITHKYSTKSFPSAISYYWCCINSVHGWKDKKKARVIQAWIYYYSQSIEMMLEGINTIVFSYIASFVAFLHFEENFATQM